MLQYKHLVPVDSKRPHQDVLRGQLEARTHCIHEAMAALVQPSTLTEIAYKAEEIAKQLGIKYKVGITFTAENTRNHLDQQLHRGYWSRNDGRYALSEDAIDIIDRAGDKLPSVSSSGNPTSNLALLPETPMPTSQELSAEEELETKWAWVKQRQKQSKFRELAIKNFEGACCLTGVKDSDLLVAAHIVRWTDDPETRLRPDNGLLLYHEYDLLFENGYFYFDDDYKVCVAKWTDTCSPLVRDRLEQIAGRSISNKAKWWPTGLQYLQRHRTRVSKSNGPLE